jgi:uncharacterized protein (TIGR00369 family)
MMKLPGSKNCFVCGRENPLSLRMSFYVREDGSVESRLQVSEQYEGYPGMVHGGVIAAMLDETAGRAVTVEDQNQFYVTSELKIRYKAPVPINQPLLVVGRKVRCRGKVCFGHGEVLDAAGTVLAEADGIFVNVTENQDIEMNPDVDGWKVYPDE